MKTETSVMKSKAIFSDDMKHRLLLYKEWDKDKPCAMIMMINPNTADILNVDMTTTLILNNMYKLGFGSVNIVNLYSRITDKISFRFNSDEDLIARDCDEIIQQYASMNDAIIIAWGTVGNHTERVRERQKYVLNLMKPYANKMYQIGRNACHPLTPAVRNEWNLEPFEMEEI